MIEFLRQVARHYVEEDDLCMVFPNRRAQVFFLKYLSEEVRTLGKPAIAPQSFTIDGFIYHIAGERKTDKIILLLRLYECYSKLFLAKNGKAAESLDDFIFWGDVILKDFSDVDRYRIDARQLFRNVSDYKRLSDDFSYLTQEQKEAMRLFLDRINPEKEMDSNFQKVWDILYPLYEEFRTVLSQEGLSYDGMVYRKASEDMGHLPECKKFVFVGLNALDECERTVMKKLSNAGKAEFCWDFSGALLRDESNQASLFLRKNVEMFPQAFKLDEAGLPKPKVTVAGVASSVAQAKLMNSILEDMPEEFKNERTAVIIPDESMLVPVMNSIPDDIAKVNISMGLPMRNSEIYALMGEIGRMQLHIIEKGNVLYFYYKQVYSIFSNNIFKSALSEEGRMYVEQIKKSRKYYIPFDAFGGDELLRKIFRKADVPSNYLKEIVLSLVPALKEGGAALELDFAKRYHEAVSRLEECGLPEMKLATYLRLLNQILMVDSVPFKGEPLCGLQIMGPLETRAVDFDNVIILSCNEGIFPKHPVSSSFIPGELRFAFGLPTYAHHDAMNAYYFYRLIQRASRVWMLYDSRMKNMKAGEESRYIKQLEMLYSSDVGIERISIKPEWRNIDEVMSFEKTDEVMEKLKSVHISPSSMKGYKTCPAKFYFHVVKGLRIQDELEDSLDARTMGNVFHNVMEDIYKVSGNRVSGQYLENWVSDKEKLEKLVETKIVEEMNVVMLEGRNLVYRNLIVEYARKTLQRDIEYLFERKAESFRILKLEGEGRASEGGMNFMGRIDRMDSVADGEVRVVDYKTGSTGGKAAEDINLQMHMYNMFVRAEKEFENCRVLNSVYSPADFFIEGVKDVPEDDPGIAKQRDYLSAAVEEILNQDIPFTKKPNEKNCKICDFKSICRK